MLVPGETAPEFDAPTSLGRRLKLSQLRGRPVVLYFFPKSGSLGCTAESNEFAHAYPEFQAKEAEVVGVSVDTPDAQSKFAEECSLPFPLVADADKEIARRYGVLGAFGRARRVTFIINPTGHIIDVVDSLLPKTHVERASRALR